MSKELYEDLQTTDPEKLLCFNSFAFSFAEKRFEHTWELSFFSVFSFFFFSAKEGNGHYWRKKEGKKKEKKEIVKNLEKCDKIVL